MRSSYTDPPSWDLLRVVHGNAVEDQFEAFSKDLFARRVGKSPTELLAYANQPGIEVEPVKVGAKHVSFQSKFKNDDTVNWGGFEGSLKKAIKEKTDRKIALDVIIHYTNGTGATKNKARDKIEELAATAGIEIVWVYGTELLGKVEEPGNHDLRRKYFRGGRNLSLTIPTAARSPYVSAIKFQVELVPFHGRTSEIHDLLAFANTPSALSWTIIAGGGGLGKSRLALELCKRLRDAGWHAGFWTPDNLASLQDWRPERDHFVVCDYLNDREDEVIKLIERAMQIAGETHRDLRVRVLLLDREAATARDKLCSSQTVGPSIANLYQAHASINLDPLASDEVLAAIEELAEILGLSADFFEAIREWIANVDVRHRMILASLLCLHASELEAADQPVDLTKLVREFLHFERQRWAATDIDDNVEKVLLLATLLGGIARSGPSLGSKAKTLITTLKRVDVYEMIVGEPAKENLAPLSHDLVGELFVLDGLAGDSADDRSKFTEMTQIALDVDQGKGMVSFFTRAANDYSGHPSLGFLLTPFSNVEPAFSVWFLIIANVIDKIPATAEEKFELFQRANDGILQLKAPQKQYLDILRGFFLRLLFDLTRNDGLTRWIGEYRIVDTGTEDLPPSTVPIKERVIVGNQPIELLPKEYCNIVVAAFAAIEPPSRKRLANPHLLETYSHGLLHTLSNRPVDFDALQFTMDIMFQAFDNRWMPGLCSVVSNTLAALVNFNHARQQPDEVKLFTNKLLDDLDERSSYDGIAECYSVASAVLRAAVTDLQSVQSLFDRIETKFPIQSLSQNETLATAYIGLAVAGMYGFQSNADYTAAHSRARTSLDLCHAFPSDRNIENTMLGIGQLLRYQGEFSSSADKNQIVDWVLAHASRYGHQLPSIVAKAVQEFSSRYTSSDTDASVRGRLFQITMDLIRRFRSEPLSVSVFPGGFLIQNVRAAFDANDIDAIRRVADDVAELQGLSYIDLNDLWHNLSQEFSLRWNQSNNSTEIAAAARYWLDQLPDPSRIEPVLRHIVEKHNRRSS